MSNDAPIGNVDHVAYRDGFLVGFGWALSRSRDVESIQFSLVDQRGERQPVSFATGGVRDDVKAAFPQLPWAGNSGFHFSGRLNPDASGELAVVATFERRARFSESLTLRFEAGSEAAESPLNVPRRRVRRAISLLVGGEIQLLVRLTLKLVWRRWVSLASDIGGRLLPVRADQRVVLVVDHAMGGGANKARRDLVAELLAQPATVHVLEMDLSRLEVRVETRATSLPASTTRTFPSVELALTALSPKPHRIVVNSLVSFPDTEGAISSILEYAANSEATMSIPLHDFHSVCPSYTLLDSKGVFCGVPSLGRCDSCFPSLNFPFSQFSTSQSIVEWRRQWGRVIDYAEEIIAFSESSKALFSRAYPAAKSKVTVRPHKIKKLRRAKSRPRDFELVVGVVGHITKQKGSQVLVEMARRCDAERLPVQFVVFGNLEACHDSKCVSVSGSYEAEQLPELLERHQVEVCAFLSVWPETFSYVCEEIMSMRMPLVAFNLGAPAERIKNYDGGWLVEPPTADALLQSLLIYRNTRRNNGDRTQCEERK